MAVHVADDACWALVLDLVFAASSPTVVPRHVGTGFFYNLERVLRDGLARYHSRRHLLHRLGGKLRRDAVFLKGLLEAVEVFLRLVDVLLLHLLLDRCNASLPGRPSDGFRQSVVGIGEVDDLALLVDQAGQVLSVLVDDGLLRRLVVVGAFLGALEFAEEQVKLALLLDVLAADLASGLDVLLDGLGVFIGFGRHIVYGDSQSGDCGDDESPRRGLERVDEQFLGGVGTRDVARERVVRHGEQQGRPLGDLLDALDEHEPGVVQPRGDVAGVDGHCVADNGSCERYE